MKKIINYQFSIIKKLSKFNYQLKIGHWKLKISQVLMIALVILVGGFLFFKLTIKPASAVPWPSHMSDWAKRKQLTLVNNAGTSNTLNQNTTYSVNIDTKSLANVPNDILPSCDDLRVIYQPNSTTTTELPRSITLASGATSCKDSSSTIISFPLQASITNGSTDANYYIYYSNSHALTPNGTASGVGPTLSAFDTNPGSASFVAPFNGTTTAQASGSGTPTTATGAIRYSGGKSALSFDGISDYLTLTSNTPTGTKTIEAWVKPTINSGQAYIAIFGDFLAQIGSTDHAGQLCHYNNTTYLCSTGTVNWNQWNHVAYVFDQANNRIVFYINGQNAGQVSAPAFSTQTNIIGTHGGSEYAFNGLMDEVRISNIARYTANFTPQTSPFLRDSATKLLFHFDENGADPRNSAVTFDDSGNGNNGTITGAKYVSGLVGVDGDLNTLTSLNTPSQSYTGHQGVFIEEGTTNKITNPSFENSTAYDTNWSSNGNWWTAGGVSSSNVVAAYQPVGAADLPSSYINKANPGTYNAAPGVAPTWSATTGWTFNGSTQYLTTGIMPTSSNWSAFAQFDSLTGSSQRYLFGISEKPVSTVYGFGVIPQDGYDGRGWYNSGSYFTYALGALSSGNMGFAGKTAYTNGSNTGAIDGTTFTFSKDIYLGASHYYEPGYDVSTAFFNGKLKSVAIYNTTLTAAQVLAVASAMNTVSNLTVTQNTTAPYVKFGSSSTKIVANADGNYTTIINPGNTNNHVLSAYVYNGTSGAVGGTVDATVAKLIFRGSVAGSTVYTDMGGGWWRLTYSGGAANASEAYGIQVLSGKTVYVDGIQLEAKAYATTYVDGSLGATGSYDWDADCNGAAPWGGTANNSCSTRTAADLSYPSSTSNILKQQGTVVFWMKPIDSVMSASGENYIFNGLSNSGNWLIISGNSGGTGVFYMWKTGSEYSQTIVQAPSVNSWVMMTMSWDYTTGKGVGYYNLTSTGDVTISGAPSSLGNFYIGRGSSTYSDSVISDFRIFDQALTSGQVSQLYYAGLGSHSEAAPVNKFSGPEDPLVYYKMDEGQGTTLNNSAPNIETSGDFHTSDYYKATLNGAINNPTWQSEDMCVSGKCLYFEGSNATASATATVSGIQTISFWTKPASSSGTIPFISLSDGDGNTSISSTNGTVSTTGISSPTVYVDGKASCASCVTSGSWHHIEITTATGFTARNYVLGKVLDLYFKGFMDELKFYNYVRTADKVKADYNVGASKGLALQAGAGQQGQALKNLSSGLVGYWKMDEATWSGTLNEVVDSSGNSNNGQAQGATGGKAYPSTGKFGNGGYFDGVDDYVTVSSTTYNLAGSSDLSVSLWVKLSSAATVRARVFYESTNSQNGYQIYIDTDQKIYFVVEKSDVSYSRRYNTALTTDTWYHIIGTFSNATNDIKLFLNSTEITTDGSASFSGTSTNGVIHLGGFATRFFNGTIDETRIYNRSLSPAEVSQLYNFAPGPVGYWDFNTGSGNIVKDISGNSNTGTWYGTGQRWVAGKFGKAGNFALTTSDRVITTSAAYLTPGSGNYTAEAWVKFNGTTCDSGGCGIFGTANSYRGNGYYVLYNTNPGENTFRTDFGDGTNYNTITSSAVTITNTWHHIAVVFDRSGNTVKLFVDGTVNGQGNFGSVSGALGISSFFIGSRNGSTNSVFNGSIDDVKVYNYARTPDQIMEDMTGRTDANTSLQGVTAGGKGTMGYWDFDEGQGTIAHDRSGNNNNGTLTSIASPATIVSGWNQNGKFGKALAFDGSNDYVNLPSISSITAPYSISLWFNPAKISGEQTLIGLNGSGDYPKFNLRSTGKLIAYAGAEKYKYSNTSLTSNDLNKWWHVVFVVADPNSLTNWKIYLNGVDNSGTSGANTGTYYEPSTSGMIGDGLGLIGNNFQGLIDEVKIYNFALSSDEVKTEYNKGSAMAFGINNTSDAYIAYDSFTRSNGAVGSTQSTDPNGKSIPSLPWTGSTWTVSSNGAINTPSLGNDIITNGGFDDASWWTTTGSWTFIGGVAHSDATGADLMPPSGVTANAWFSIQYTLSNHTYNQGNRFVYFNDIRGQGNGTYMITGRQSNRTDFRIRGYDVTDMDNYSMRPVTLSELFSSVSTNNSDVTANTNVTAPNGTQAGLVLNLDSTNSPANFVIAYIESRYDSGTSYYAVLDKAVAGVYTNLFRTSITYSAGAQLKVVKSGTSYSLFYNGSQVDTTQTISDAGIINNTRHGIFSTYSGNTLDNFSLQGQNISQNNCVPGDSSTCGGPIVEWNFNEGKNDTCSGGSNDICDSSGNGNDGAIAGTPTWTTGKIGKGLKFNTANSDINLYSTNFVNSFNASEGTLEVWLKPINRGLWSEAAIHRPIYIGTNDNNRLSFGINLDSSVSFAYTAGGTAKSVTYTSLMSNITDWFHVTLVWSKSQNKIYGYLNGTLVNTATSLGTWSGAVGFADIGGESAGSRVWDGWIDQLKIYNYPRTTSQIAYDYNQGKPIASYDFDECSGTVIHDGSGNLNNGTLTNATPGTCDDGTNTTAWSKGKTGKYGSSVYFDGTDDYVTVPYSSVLAPTTGISVGAWFKTTDKSAASRIVSKTETGGYNINFQSAVADTLTGTVNVGGTNYHVSYSTNNISNNQWYFVEMTYDGETSKLYINGALVDQNTNPSGNISYTYSNPLCIGSEPDSTSCLASTVFPGQIDDVKIFNYALTPLQIKTLYNQNSSIRFGP